MNTMNEAGTAFTATAWLRRHLIAMALVVVVHVLVGLVLFAHRALIAREPPPLTVRLLEAASDSNPVAPLPVPQLDPLPAPIAIMAEPIVVTATPSAPLTAIASDISTASSVVTAPEQQEPIVEARFDADYLNNPPPLYPSLSRHRREEGLVVLRVRVRADGTVDAVLVQQRSGSSRLDDAALATVKRWKFVPAKRGEQPIDSWVLVPIEFALRSRGNV